MCRQRTKLSQLDIDVKHSAGKERAGLILEISEQQKLLFTLFCTGPLVSV